MQSQTSQLLKLYKSAADYWEQAYREVVSLRGLANAGASPEVIADTCLILKKSVEKLEDTRKEINKTIGLLEKTVCLQVLSIGTGEAIRGDLCTATVNCGTEPPYLKRRDNPELFDKVMIWFGFSQEACEREIARLYWPAAQEYIAKWVGDGKPLPPYIEQLKTSSKFSLTCRVAAGVDLDSEAELQT